MTQYMEFNDTEENVNLVLNFINISFLFLLCSCLFIVNLSCIIRLRHLLPFQHECYYISCQTDYYCISFNILLTQSDLKMFW